MSNTEKKISSSSSSSSTTENDSDDHANQKAFEALNRLSLALTDLDDKKESAHLSHWRTLPTDVKEAHEMMIGGADLIKATSTKYTLVGKVDVKEGAKLAEDLRKGAELVGCGALVLHDGSIGASRSLRYYAKRCARGVVASLLKLIGCFLDGSALPANVDALHHDKNSIGAQRTGAVWEACDAMAKVPKGNRAAMRRDLLTWAAECNETMQEFHDVVDLGPMPEDDGAGAADERYDSFGADDQYTAQEIPVADACLHLLKASRGTINVTLKACECAGEQIVENASETDGETNQQQLDRNRAILSWINKLHSMARIVGEGVTDLGMTMYPPLQDYDAIEKQVSIQKEALVAIHEMILDATPLDGSAQQEIIPMSEEVTGMAGKIRAAAALREKEVKEAIKASTKR